MKRRKILTGASALAGAVLTGCGGGDGNSETGNVLSSTKAVGEGNSETGNAPSGIEVEGSSQSKVSAAANPATLVPVGTKMARLEVAFTTRRKVTVTLYNTYTGIGIKAGEKVATSSATHALQFGTAFFTNKSWAAGNLYLEVTSDTGEIGKEYIAYTDPWAEHEWSYFYRVNATAAWERIATVRFFPSEAEIENFDFTQHLKTYPNTATVQNRGNLEMTRNEVMNGELDFPDRSARVISSTGQHDTLCLPDLRRAGAGNPFELMPVLTVASGTLRRCIDERLKRQNISRSISIGAVRRRRLSDGKTDAYDSDHNYLIDAYHEVLTYVGGSQLMEFIKEKKREVQTQFAAFTQYNSKPLENFARNNSSELYPETEMSAVRRTLKKVADQLPVVGAGGLSGSLNVQIAGAFQFPLVPLLWTGFGGRISIGVGRFSVGASADGNKVKTGWPVPDSPFKVGLVFVLKGKSIGGTVDYDLEITGNFNFQYGKAQVANVQIDPVFDIDTREGVLELVRDMFRYILNYEPPGLVILDEAGLPVRNLRKYFESLNEQANQAANRDPLSVISGIAVVTDYVQVDITRLYATLEVSPLRIVFHNKRAADDKFSNEAPIWATAWVPGVKYISGFGYESKTSVEAGGVVDFRAAWYGRIALTADLHGVFSRDPVARALSNFPDNS